MVSIIDETREAFTTTLVKRYRTVSVWKMLYKFCDISIRESNILYKIKYGRFGFDHNFGEWFLENMTPVFDNYSMYSSFKLKEEYWNDKDFYQSFVILFLHNLNKDIFTNEDWNPEYYRFDEFIDWDQAWLTIWLINAWIKKVGTDFSDDIIEEIRLQDNQRKRYCIYSGKIDNLTNYQIENIVYKQFYDDGEADIFGIFDNDVITENLGKFEEAMKEAMEEDEITLNPQTVFRIAMKNIDNPEALANTLDEATREDNWLPIEAMRNAQSEDIMEIRPPTLDTTNGWLSPEGDLYPCLTIEHNNLQVALERATGIKDLEVAGWIKLMDGSTTSLGAMLRAGKDWWHMSERNATDAQKKTIKDWSDKYGYEIPEWIDDNWKPTKLKSPTEPRFKKRKDLDGD